MSSESVKVTILKKDECLDISEYNVIVKITQEFMNEPEEILSKASKMNYISERIKEEFYKVLTKNI